MKMYQPTIIAIHVLLGAQLAACEGDYAGGEDGSPTDDATSQHTRTGDPAPTTIDDSAEASSETTAADSNSGESGDPGSSESFESPLTDHVDLTESEEPKVNLRNGNLSFRSMSDFQRTLHLLQNGRLDLESWESQVAGYTSMRSAFDALTERDKINIGLSQSERGFETLLALSPQGDGLEAVRLIDDPSLATLVSRHAMVYIEGYAYRFYYDRIERQGTEAITGDGVDIIPISRIALKPKPTAALDVPCENIYWNSGIKKRTRGEVTLYHAGLFLSGFVAVSKHQKAIANIWWADDAPRIGLALDGYVSAGLAGLHLYHNKLYYNTESKSSYSFSGGQGYILHELLTNHTFTNDLNEKAFCIFEYP